MGTKIPTIIDKHAEIQNAAACYQILVITKDLDRPWPITYVLVTGFIVNTAEEYVPIDPIVTATIEEIEQRVLYQLATFAHA